MDEVHGIIFISFAGVSTCLPMLSPFHIRNPCGERESFQTRNLNPKHGKAMGAPPPNPLENKKIKDSNPPCCPRAANNREGRKKEKKESMGAVRPQTPNQEQSSWTSSVGSLHTRQDTTRAVTFAKDQVLMDCMAPSPNSLIRSSRGLGDGRRLGL